MQREGNQMAPELDLQSTSTEERSRAVFAEWSSAASRSVGEGSPCDELNCIVVMKVGPHSGLDLGQIVASKHREEAEIGVHFWGYSGTACHPRLVQAHAQLSEMKYGRPPILLLSETKSAYEPGKGQLREFSCDGVLFSKLPFGTQLTGAQYAFVARHLRAEARSISLHEFRVFGGRNHGKPLSEHLRGRVGKACAHKVAPISAGNSASTTADLRIALSAELVPPYVVWLR